MSVADTPENIILDQVHEVLPDQSGEQRPVATVIGAYFFDLILRHEAVNLRCNRTCIVHRFMRHLRFEQESTIPNHAVQVSVSVVVRQQ